MYVSYMFLCIHNIYPVSREEKSNNLSLKLVPHRLFSILVYELGISNDIMERFGLPRELLPSGIFTDDGASFLADKLSSAPIDKDQSGDGIHLESGG